MNYLRKTAAVILCLMLVVMLGACGSSGSGGGGKTGEGSGSSTTNVKALEMYKKITIGMTKDQVNAALGIAPVPEPDTRALPNSFLYKDNNGEFVVSAVYNDKNIMYSKTVTINDKKLLAPLTAKAVTQEQSDKITSGMTNDEVVKILGGDGVECSATALNSDLTKVGVIKYWGNKDGSFIQVVYNSSGKVSNSTFFTAR